VSTEQLPKVWSMDVVKISAGSLAAVSAAVAASTLGVAGTLGGAALASIVGSVGTELYANSLQRGYRRLRKAEPGTVDVPADEAPSCPVPADPDATVVLTTPTTAGALSYGPTATPEPDATAGPGPARRPRWKRILLVSVVAFALAMVAITAFEALAGRSLAGLFGDDGAGATTIGTVTDRQPAPAPSAPDGGPPASVAPSTGTDPSATPSVSDAPTGPTPATTTAPSAPVGEPTGAPAVDVTPSP
jgi:hypothetical protein